MQRIILLRKNLNANNEDMSWLGSEDHAGFTHWRVLGHFDEMFIYESDEKNLLESLCSEKERIDHQSDHSLCGESNETNGRSRHCAYYYPLFVIPSTSASEIDPNVYDSLNFIAVVRIHFSKTVDLEEQYENLQETIKQEFCKKNNELIQNGKSAVRLFYQCYYATEFSDMVLEVRCNRLCTLIDAVFGLFQTDNIDRMLGKTYTYFGINSAFIHSDQTTDNSDVIPLFHIRFEDTNSTTLELVRTCSEVLGPDHEYYVTGMDDILLNYYNLPTARLVNLFRKWFKDGSDFPRSFSTIRIGAPLDEGFKNRSMSDQKNQKSLDDMCNRMMNSCIALGKWIDDHGQNVNWFPSISKIAFSLDCMHTSPIMDEVEYLLVPAISAFLEHSLQNRESLISEKNSRFVENCTYFMEQLMRIEGQLSLKAEIRPAIYNIPVFMLEYTIAFIQKVSSLLKLKDEESERNRNTEFLLIPCPCERVKATEIVATTANETGLVHLAVPELLLYKPESFLVIVCHELSHYVGEYVRNRVERKHCFCQAVAALFTQLWYRSMELQIAEQIETSLLGAISFQSVPLTMRNMRDIVLKEIHTYFGYYSCLNGKPDSDSLPNERDGFMFMFGQQVEHLVILFRECYADICMLRLLDISDAEYVDLHMQELQSAGNLDQVKLEAYAIRFYVVLKALGRAFATTFQCETSYKLFTIYGMIERALEEDSQEQPLTVPYSSVYALKSYTDSCVTKMSDLLKADGQLPPEEQLGGPIQQMYSTIISSQDDKNTFRTVLKCIEDYRSQRNNMGFVKTQQGTRCADSS